MTATRLQTVLGESIDQIRSVEGDSQARKKEIDKLEVLLKAAKNHINNSMVILQAAKIIKDEKKKKQAIDLVLGDM